MLRSRQVLIDCRRATRLADEAASAQDVRVHWVAAIVLARAVGHVLLNIDSANDPAIASANDVRFAEWNAHPDVHQIYWEFILAERNTVLKEYEQNWQFESIYVTAGDELFELDDGLYCAISRGPYAGADVRDVLDLAIDWWEEQLGIIESIAAESA